MNKKPLIILLVFVVMAMSFLIWFKNSEDINENLGNANATVEVESGENIPSQSTGGIDINLSGDNPIDIGKESSGENVTSGENLNNSDVKEPVNIPENPPINSTETENNTTNTDVDSGDISVGEETINPVLVSDNTKLAFKMGAKQVVVYYYEGETITKKEAYIDYQTEADAKTAAAQYNDGTKSLSDIGDVKSASSQGKYVVMTYNEAEYQELTYSKVKAIYGKYEITK